MCCYSEELVNAWPRYGPVRLAFGETGECLICARVPLGIFAVGVDEDVVPIYLDMGERLSGGDFEINVRIVAPVMEMRGFKPPRFRAR